MQNDNAITRLLYAILSQKCLKDINWDKVAHNPLLNAEITNGHAARMRYSRFKKQMDAASGNVPPVTPRKPRKNRVEKTRSPKKERRGGASGVKDEPERERDRDEKRKGKEKEVKSEYERGGREDTGESLFSPSGSLMDDRDRGTPELEGGMIPSPAVSLAQHDLSSGLNLNLHHSHPHDLGINHAQPLHFQDIVQVKRERKPSANTLHTSGLYAPSHSPLLRAPHGVPTHLDFHTQSHVTSSVSNSTLPSTPRMCIEDPEHDHDNIHEVEYADGNSPHSPSSRYLAHAHSHHHPQNQHHSQEHDHVSEHDSFGLAGSTNLNGDDMDELMHSFDMAHPSGGYSPLLSHGGPFGFGMEIGADGYEDFWSGGMGGGENGESSRMGAVMGGDCGGGGAVVKKEERWDEAYRRV